MRALVGAEATTPLKELAQYCRKLTTRPELNRSVATNRQGQPHYASPALPSAAASE